MLGILLLAGAGVGPAFAGDSRCYLQGTVSAVGANEAKPSITDMLRMKFDADNRAKCEEMLKSYCFYQLKEKDFSPVKLKASWKPDLDKKEEYTYSFNAKCKLIRGED